MNLKTASLAGALALPLMAPSAHAGDSMQQTFHAIGEMTRAGFMCPDADSSAAAVALGHDPKVQMFLRAHEAQAKAWMMGGMRKFDQLDRQRGHGEPASPPMTPP
jgi:hypothetical protein